MIRILIACISICVVLLVGSALTGCGGANSTVLPQPPAYLVSTYVNDQLQGVEAVLTTSDGRWLAVNMFTSSYLTVASTLPDGTIALDFAMRDVTFYTPFLDPAHDLPVQGIYVNGTGIKQDDGTLDGVFQRSDGISGTWHAVPVTTVPAAYWGVWEVFSDLQSPNYFHLRVTVDGRCVPFGDSDAITGIVDREGKISFALEQAIVYAGASPQTVQFLGRIRLDGTAAGTHGVDQFTGQWTMMKYR